MDIIKKSDYVINAVHQKELLVKALIGLKTFNPRSMQIEVIDDIFIIDKKKNVGTILNKKWEVFPVVTGIKVKIAENGTITEGIYKFDNTPGKLWIDKILPAREELYRKITTQDKLLNQL